MIRYIKTSILNTLESNFYFNLCQKMYEIILQIIANIRRASLMREFFFRSESNR